MDSAALGYSLLELLVAACCTVLLAGAVVPLLVGSARAERHRARALDAELRVDSALQIVSKQRADLGAYQNRFEEAAKGVAIAAENMQAAESLIRDTDMAARMVEYVKNQILTQAGSAMLAQANLKTQSVLQLLG